MWFADSRGDVPGIDSMLVFRPPLGLAYCFFVCLLGSITCRMFRLCGESIKLSWIDLTRLDEARSHVIVYLMQNHGTIGYQRRSEGNPGSRSRADRGSNLMFTCLPCRKLAEQSITFLTRYRSGGTPLHHQDACIGNLGPLSEEPGTPAVLATSRLSCC